MLPISLQSPQLLCSLSSMRTVSYKSFCQNSTELLFSSLFRVATNLVRRLCERGRGSRGMSSGVWAGLLLVTAPLGQAECSGAGCVPGPAVSSCEVGACGQTAQSPCSVSPWSPLSWVLRRGPGRPSAALSLHPPRDS